MWYHFQMQLYSYNCFSRLRQGRIPGVTVLAFLLNWIWPRDRCRSGTGSLADWHPDYLHPNSKSLGRISRAADGRFVLVDSALSSRAGSFSNVSSSDDGGFIPRGRGRASWRKPLVGYPSQLSLRSDGSGQSARGGISAFLGALTHFAQPRYHYPIKQVPAIYSPTPVTPTTPRFQSSSPATSSALLLSPWTPIYFSDLSSVRHPSSAERSYPTPPGFMQLRTVHQRYSQELPSLRAIHEESYSNQFIPVHPIHDSPIPGIRVPPSYPALPGPLGGTTRPRAKLLPRHARIARSAPELGSPDHLEQSPESRSSSSGFGSKNTSSQQNQSSQSGSFTDWRLLPPYRPPPPPPPPLVGHWLEFTSRLHEPSPSSSEPLHKALDVGSVDGHYEFDPATPTPTPSTPTGPTAIGDLDSIPLRKGYGTLRSTRYDNIEARVQAMKEEFNEFRKRQAKRRRSHELESAC